MKEVLKQRTIRGSSALSLLGATSLGLFVTLGFANLSHYLSTKNALDQSVRVTARCLTPSDPACIELEDTLSADTFRYFSTTTTPAADTFARVMRYSATMYQQQLSGNLPYYRTAQQLAPSYTFQGASLPTALFERIPSYSRYLLHTRYSGTEGLNYATPTNPRFPNWNESRERSLEDVPFSSQGRENGFREIFSQSFSLRLSEDGERFLDFSPTGSTALSTLIGAEGDTISCLDGSRCSVADLASSSASGGVNDYRSHRFAAVYVEVELAEVSNGLRLGIQGREGRAGLFLERLSRAGRKLSTFALGGRDLESVRGKRSFNMWLRGPKGSHGGDSGVTYSDLKFDLKDRIRPIVNLRVQGSAGDSIRGTVRVHAFTDRYQARRVEQTVSIQCPVVEIPYGSTLEATRMTPQNCGAARGAQVEYEDRVEVIELGCVPGANTTLWPEGVNPTSKEDLANHTTVALCNSTDRPRAASQCGWRRISDGKRTEPISRQQLLGCPLARIEERTISCFGESKPVPLCRVSSLNEANCPAVQTEIRRHLEGLPPNVELPQELGSVSFRRVEGGRVEDSLGCQEESFAGVSCSTRELTPVTYAPSFVRVDGEKQPELSSAVTESSSPVCSELSPTNLDGEVVAVKLERYPFTREGELELLPLLPQENGGCELSRTMEEVLREYAAIGGYPEARNQQVRFDYQIEDTGERRLIARTEGCKTTVYSDSGACNLLNSVPNRGTICQQTTEIGVFDSAPEQCLSGSCFRVPVPVERNVDQSPNISVERATRLGEQLFSRYLPGAKPKLEINFSDERTVSVRARYPFRPGWPLNRILGREELMLEKSLYEEMESR